MVKVLLLVIVGLLVVPRVFDYFFHGGNTYDLVAAAGGAMLPLAIVLEQRAARRGPPAQATGRRLSTLLCMFGIALILLSLLLQRKVVG